MTKMVMPLRNNRTTGDSLQELLEKSWQVRHAFFPDRIEFAFPTRTLAVSVTGTNCELDCAHCGGKYLKNMVTIDKALAANKRIANSYLVSGGCTSEGRVPLEEHWPALKKLAGCGLLNLHTGLVSRTEAKHLGELASVVSFDLPGDDETITSVYGLSYPAEQYLEAYRNLLRYTRVVPHLCIGLDGGRIRGEYRLLQKLQVEAVEAISLIVFRPTAGTAFENASPPPLEEVARLIAAVRLMFPRIPISLGCMRPGGQYRDELDLLALKAGVNKIVLPAPSARHHAGKLGLDIHYSEECCSL
jgi:lipoyl synthase